MISYYMEVKENLHVTQVAWITWFENRYKFRPLHKQLPLSCEYTWAERKKEKKKERENYYTNRVIFHTIVRISLSGSRLVTHWRIFPIKKHIWKQFFISSIHLHTRRINFQVRHLELFIFSPVLLLFFLSLQTLKCLPLKTKRPLYSLFLTFYKSLVKTVLSTKMTPRVLKVKCCSPFDKILTVTVAIQCIGEAFGVDADDEEQKSKYSTQPATLLSIFDVYLKTKSKTSAAKVFFFSFLCLLLIVVIAIDTCFIFFFKKKGTQRLYFRSWR